MTTGSARLRLVSELAATFAAQLDLDALLALVVSRCAEVLDAEGASVLLLDERGEELRFPHVAADDPARGAGAAPHAVSRHAGDCGRGAHRRTGPPHRRRRGGPALQPGRRPGDGLHHASLVVRAASGPRRRPRRPPGREPAPRSGVRRRRPLFRRRAGGRHRRRPRERAALRGAARVGGPAARAGGCAAPRSRPARRPRQIWSARRRRCARSSA